MSKSKIELLTVEQIIDINKVIVQRHKQKHLCLDPGKIESAIHAAFYPGDYPFQFGGIAKVAGALCYFLTKAHGFFDGNKRTAGIASTVFMNLNGYDLKYYYDVKKDENEFADLIDGVAANKISKEEMIKWFGRKKFLVYE